MRNKAFWDTEQNENSGKNAKILAVVFLLY